MLLAALLAACGGGAGDESVATGPAPAAPAASTAGGASASGPMSTGTCSLPDFMAGVLARINQLRASGADCGSAGRFGATTAMRWNVKLVEAADSHSLDMAAGNYFSHTSADGRTLSHRVDATGVAWSSLGENIAAGQPSVDAVMDAWAASPGHCANLMNAGFTDVGLACVPGTATSSYRTYWTMDLARVR